MALPEIAWEASLGIYAARKGFLPGPITQRAELPDVPVERRAVLV